MLVFTLRRLSLFIFTMLLLTMLSFSVNFLFPGETIINLSGAINATPSQLVFGHDAIVNNKYEANQDTIKAKKQKKINLNNVRENAKRTPHTYKVGDKVILTTESNTKFGQNPYKGPYEVFKINDNGTIKFKTTILLTL